MTKAIKLAFAVIFWPVAIFLISKSIRGRILGGVSTLFYAYAIYHLSDRFFDDSATANAQHFIFYYQSVAEVVVALLLVLALIAVKTNSKSSREATSLGTRGKHIRGRIFKPFNKFGGLKTGSLLFGQHRIDPKILKTHAIVSGTTGSGKTQTLYPLIKYIVENNLKAIITDPKIEFSQKFMKNGDIVLSPFLKNLRNGAHSLRSKTITTAFLSHTIFCRQTQTQKRKLGTLMRETFYQTFFIVCFKKIAEVLEQF